MECRGWATCRGSIQHPPDLPRAGCFFRQSGPLAKTPKMTAPAIRPSPMSVSGRSRSRVAIIGAGPGGLVLATALARRGNSEVTVYDRAEDHKVAPRFNPDRSYTIDITGHGLNALRYIDAVERFDKDLIKFSGVRVLAPGLKADYPWKLPGWTGSRGDICRALQSNCEEKHPGKVTYVWNTVAEVVDVQEGALRLTGPGGAQEEKNFDLVVACDGAGSSARRAMEQLPGFSTEKKILSSYCTMLQMDQNTEDLDPEWLMAYQVKSALVVAGAINGEKGPSDPKWFCMVGFDHSHEFKSSEEARAHIAKEAPALLNYISDKELESFAKRPCSHIGRAVKCSKLHAGRVALVGDAGNAYPPIGQGINHAMESASVLDKCIADTEEAGKDIAEALALYTKVWLPEAHAINWIAQRVEFGNTWKAILNTVSFLLGISVVQDAKRNDKTWSELAQAAQRRQAALKVAGCSILSLAVAGAAMSIARWR